MREIDSPQSNDKSEARLTQALQSLTMTSASSAPAEIGDELAGAFRRHHARRRMVRGAMFTALAACLAVFAVLLLRAPSHNVLVKTPEKATIAPPAKAVPSADVSSGAKTSAPLPSSKKQRPSSSRKRTVPPQNDFVVLASYGQPARGEELRVVRLEVTGRALRVVGAPAIDEIEDRRVLADFVVGQDGTPYGVRLVSMNNDLR